MLTPMQKITARYTSIGKNRSAFKKPNRKQNKSSNGKNAPEALELNGEYFRDNQSIAQMVLKDYHYVTSTHLGVTYIEPTRTPRWNSGSTLYSSIQGSLFWIHFYCLTFGILKSTGESGAFYLFLFQGVIEMSHLMRRTRALRPLGASTLDTPILTDRKCKF